MIGTWMRVDVAYALVLDERAERVLMVRNEHVWSLPGGAREPGEMLAQTAIREVREETGLDVAVRGIVHVDEKVIGASHALFVTFRGEIVGGTIGTRDTEIRQIAWKSLTEAERLMPYLRDIPALVCSPAHYQSEPIHVPGS